MKIYFLFFGLIFLAGSVFAQDLTIPFNKEYDLKRTCENNGTFCSSSAVCNATVIKPSGQLLLDNALMTNQNAYHNVTIPASTINELGEHKSFVTCTDFGGDIAGNGLETFSIEVTGDGQTFRQFPMQILALMVGIVMIVVGKLREDFALIQNIGAVLVMIMGVVTLYPGYAGLNYSNLTGQAVGTVSLGLGFYFLIERAFSRDDEPEGFTQPDDGRFHG